MSWSSLCRMRFNFFKWNEMTYSFPYRHISGIRPSHITQRSERPVASYGEVNGWNGSVVGPSAENRLSPTGRWFHRVEVCLSVTQSVSRVMYSVAAATQCPGWIDCQSIDLRHVSLPMNSYMACRSTRAICVHTSHLESRPWRLLSSTDIVRCVYQPLTIKSTA